MTDREKELLLQLLGVLASGALITAAALAPGLLLGFAPLLEKKTKANRTQIREALRYARKRQWVNVRQIEDDLVLEITTHGRKRYQKLQMNRPLTGGKWDGFWRLVIFDIPDEHKTARDSLRFILKRLGLYQLQESVWLTPWRCDDHIAAIRELYGIPQHVLLIEATKIENDTRLRAKFNL